MLGNFTYCNPTKLYFGKNALEGLNAELPKYGKNVLLVYGGGSIKRNGIYDKVVAALKANGKNVTEDAGVMPNPTVEKLYEGCERARACKATSFLRSAAGPCATIRKRCPCPPTARKTRGTNISCVWKTWTTRLSPSDACLRWSARAAK